MMDFLNFDHYFNSPLNIRKAIFVASAFVISFLKKLCFGIGGGTRTIKEAIMGWAKFPLSCNQSETTYDIVVIHYHGEAHWNLLVL
jgi:hypothetical protein